MNCEKCQELLSDYLDGALSREEHARLSAHVEECLSCYAAHNELNSILSFCREQRGDYDAPPNERALWLRIRNTIEGESARAAASAAHVTTSAQREHWWTRWMTRSWELSVSQMAMAVAAIVITVSLATAVSLRRMQNSPEAATTTAKVNGASSADRPTLTVSGPTFYVRELSQEIDYWQQRVDDRKMRWSRQRREDFDLNLKVINEAVQERFKDLKENPHDEMTKELLNAVLNNKAELLKEFADL